MIWKIHMILYKNFEMNSSEKNVNVHWNGLVMEFLNVNEIPLFSATHILIVNELECFIDVSHIVLCFVPIFDTRMLKNESISRRKKSYDAHFNCSYQPFNFTTMYLVFHRREKKRSCLTWMHREKEEKWDHTSLGNQQNEKNENMTFCAAASLPPHCSLYIARASILMVHHKKMLVVMKLLCAKNKLNKCACVCVFGSYNNTLTKSIIKYYVEFCVYEWWYRH